MSCKFSKSSLLLIAFASKIFNLGKGLIGFRAFGSCLLEFINSCTRCDWIKTSSPFDMSRTNVFVLIQQSCLHNRLRFSLHHFQSIVRVIRIS
mmetsp:Transcript_20370/g.56360  ORF Transcript_20370/g.56360 Transcript_20370/m.56360 type:complete len:93 (-) Transcript_20370:18-296(-)